MILIFALLLKPFMMLIAYVLVDGSLGLGQLAIWPVAESGLITRPLWQTEKRAKVKGFWQWRKLGTSSCFEFAGTG
jgi:hypothetical protein